MDSRFTPRRMPALDISALHAQPLSVLVAESHSAARRQLSDALQAMGLATFQASLGEEVVDIVRVAHIHALILDNDMPDLGGLEAIRVIRTFREVPPFLLLAATITRDLRMAALEGQATSLLPKPVDTALLSDIVQTMLLRSYGSLW